MRADNTAALRRAAEQRHHDTVSRARAAIRRLAKTGEPVTFNTVAREAGVSRAWLYANPDIRATIHHLRHRTRATGNSVQVPAAQRATEAGLRSRLEVAHARNRELAAEVSSLRDQIAHLQGELRAARSRGYGRTAISSPAAESTI